MAIGRIAVFPLAFVDSGDKTINSLILPLGKEIRPITLIVGSYGRVAVMGEGEGLAQDSALGQRPRPRSASRLWAFNLLLLVDHLLVEGVAAIIIHDVLSRFVVTLPGGGDIGAGDGEPVDRLSSDL